MKWKKVTAVILVFCMMLQLCGFSFWTVTVAVDTDENPVYKYYTVKDIISRFQADPDGALNQFDRQYVLVAGEVAGVDKNGKMLTLKDQQSDGELRCTCDNEIMGSVFAYVPGDQVALYGQMNGATLRANRIGKVYADPPSDLYLLKDGTSIDRNEMEQRTLKNGKVSYYIPKGLKSVEHDIIAEGLGVMEGYQYVLNQVPGSTDVMAETLFVCYFDNGELANTDDIGKTKYIEKAIIDNISGNSDRFQYRKVKTYYGKEYHYFTGKYSDKLGNGYHAEYIFQKDGNSGTVVYLYIYKDAKHLPEVLFLTRFLEVE